MTPFCNIRHSALCRRDDEMDPESEAEFREIVFISYLIAFLVAAAVTIYIVAYFKPPQKWKWHCRLRGRLDEPCRPSLAPTDGTLEIDDGFKDRSAGRTGRWVRGALTKMFRREPSERRNGSVPSNSIKRTAAYIVQHEPAPVPPTSISATTNASPFAHDGQSREEPHDASAEPRIYGGGTLPWR